MNIFILEDNDQRIKFFRKLFLDHNVICSTTVDDAIETVDSLEFDMIMLDHDLGGKLGMGFMQDKTGLGLVDYIIDKDSQKNTSYIIHSQNPVGAVRMLNALRDSGRKVRIKPFTLIYSEQSWIS